MTGLSVEEFQELLTAVHPHYERLIESHRQRAQRKRAPGGGVKSRHDLTERLLMTMVWLRLYLTCEAVGVLFAVDKSTVSRFTKPVLLILRDLGMETLGWPQEARSLAEAPQGPPTPPAGSASTIDGAAGGVSTAETEPSATTECPDQVAIIDATEQRVQRSQDYPTQKAHYSGKKKAHTRKTQVVVNERGRIRHISDSAPGSTHDLTLLRQSGVIKQLPPGLTAMADCGYRGMQNDMPERSVALPYRPKSGEQLLPEEKFHNHMVSRIRVVVENALAEMKHFRILSDVFRHAMERYDSITLAIAGIVNHRIDGRLVHAMTT